MLNFVAIVLARGGSKRIPKKNIKPLAGKPLITWTIEAALDSRIFSRILVSTDDLETAEIVKAMGISVPWMRPRSLAKDDSLPIDAILHALDKLKNDEKVVPDGVMMLQPTSPFRTAGNIRTAADLFELNSCQPVVSFSKTEFNPEWCFRVNSNSIQPLLGWKKITTRSQDIQPVLQLTGAIYLATPRTLIDQRSFLGPTTIPLIILDIN